MIVDTPDRIAQILERLPLAVMLIDSSGALLGRTGQLAGVIGSVIPSRDELQASRWRFADKRDAAYPRHNWPGARSLRGETNYAGMIGRYQNAGDHIIRVVSVPAVVPAGTPKSDVAAVAFLQLIDPRPNGSDIGLEHNLIDMLARSFASAWTQPTAVQ